MDWKSITSLLIEQLEEPIVIIDHAEVVRLVNPALEKLLGRRRHTLLGRSWIEECVADEDRPVASWWLEHALRGAVRQCDMPVRCSDQRRLMVTFDVRLVGLADTRGVIAQAIDTAELPTSTGHLQGIDYYEVCAESDNFGQLHTVWSGAQVTSSSEAVGRICYRARFSRSEPCTDCPVKELTMDGAAVTKVIVDAQGKGLEVLTAEWVGDGRAGVSVRSVDGETIGQLLRARISQLAEQARLSDRERTVLDYLTMGRSLSEIATILGISRRTVKFHQENLLQKIGADSRLDLMRLLL